MVEHVNFYENIKEANARLRCTIVLYDGAPYYIFAITDHRGDGVFRVYMRELGKCAGASVTPIPYWNEYGPDWPELGPRLDAFITGNPNSGLVRKSMDSSYFNKFRPFPLGMINIGTKCYYLERQPIRPKMEQGLIYNAVCSAEITTAAYSDELSPSGGMRSVYFISKEMEDCILGRHPSAAECVANLMDPKVKNEAHAFHRDFALARGPLGILFLAYKSDVVGVLPRSNTTEVRLGRKFGHVKEAVRDLGVFGNIS